MLSDGNPEVFAPEFYARLSRLERHQVANYYERRLLEEGRGNPGYPDDEDPARVARRALIEGTFLAGYAYGGPATLLGSAALALVISNKFLPVAAVVLVACVLVLATVLFRWIRRVREIGRYFDTILAAGPVPAQPAFTPETTGEIVAQRGAVRVGPGADEWVGRSPKRVQRLLVVFGSLDVAVIWTLWSLVGFSILVPSVFTAATVAVIFALVHRASRRTG